jgi:hypothetical protein
MLHIRPEDIARFMRYVEKLPGRLILPDGRETTACWVWTGARSRGKGNKKWYGSFRLGRRVVRAHRFSCEAFKGEELPADHGRDHLCCFSLCVNPDHIEIVHKTVNQERMVANRRAAREPLSPLGKPYPNGTVDWFPGQSEDRLYGFATEKDRDAHARGEPGPFRRVLRGLNDPPPSDEVLLTRALCAGTVKETIEYLSAREKAKETKQ